MGLHQMGWCHCINLKIIKSSLLISEMNLHPGDMQLVKLTIFFSTFISILLVLITPVMTLMKSFTCFLVVLRCICRLAKIKFLIYCLDKAAI